MANEHTNTLLKSIKEDSKDIPTNFTSAAYAMLSEKVKEKKKQIAKTMFAKKEEK